MTTEAELVLYRPQTTGIATVLKNQNGQLVCRFSGKGVAELKEKYPGTQVFELNDAVDQVVAAQRAKHCKDWEPSSQEEFDEQLNVLPPRSWHTLNGVEFFSMSERLSGEITGYYAHHKSTNKFYRAYRSVYEDPETIANEVTEAAK